EDWDALYIDGKDDNGKSKNWIQDTLLSSPAFPGSPLDVLLHGGGKGGAISELPDLDTPEETKEPEPVPEELTTKGKADKKKKTPPADAGENFDLPTL
ncbi:hypothetical protein ABEP46_12315, partial [Cutibacterium acnes]